MVCCSQWCICVPAQLRSIPLGFLLTGGPFLSISGPLADTEFHMKPNHRVQGPTELSTQPEPSFQGKIGCYCNCCWGKERKMLVGVSLCSVEAWTVQRNGFGFFCAAKAALLEIGLYSHPQEREEWGGEKPELGGPGAWKEVWLFVLQKHLGVTSVIQ